MAVTSTAQACDLVIFGAKGDLARRKLLPSLYQLEKAGHIHPDTRIIGVGRAEWDKEAYIKVVKEALGTFMKVRHRSCSDEKRLHTLCLHCQRSPARSIFSLNRH